MISSAISTSCLLYTSQAVNCFTKMVDEGITALVGDVTTTPTLAVAAESADYNMPMVTASALSLIHI